MQSLVGSFELREYSEGMVIAWAGEVDDCMYVIKSGQCVLTTAVTPAQRQALQDQTLQGSAKLPRVQSLGGEKLEAGARHGEQALLTAQARATTLIASKDGTQASFRQLMLCMLWSHAVPVCFDQSYNNSSVIRIGNFVQLMLWRLYSCAVAAFALAILLLT